MMHFLAFEAIPHSALQVIDCIYYIAREIVVNDKKKQLSLRKFFTESLEAIMHLNHLLLPEFINQIVFDNHRHVFVNRMLS